MGLQNNVKPGRGIQQLQSNLEPERRRQQLQNNVQPEQKIAAAEQCTTRTQKTAATKHFGGSAACRFLIERLQYSYQVKGMLGLHSQDRLEGEQYYTRSLRLYSDNPCFLSHILFIQTKYIYLPATERCTLYPIHIPFDIHSTFNTFLPITR